LLPRPVQNGWRRVIGKNISEDDLFSAVADAVSAGWSSFKLYFMIGLPTEEDDDVMAIASLCHEAEAAD